MTGACFAELGHTVVVRDIVPEKVETLRAGGVPIHEPGLKEVLERNLERLGFTLDVGEALDGAEFVFICVDTPPTYAGDADLSRVWTVIEELRPLEGRPVLVMKSTVPVGTGEKVRAALDARGFEGWGYASNPEFLAEGTAVRDFLEPDRVVIGAFEEADADALEQLHKGIDAPFVKTDVASAEMIKLASNAFLPTRISFINEIANVCELVGADVEAVAQGVGLDSRIGTRYLRPGIGYGGSCLTGDETVLVRKGSGARLAKIDTLFDELAIHDEAAVAYPSDLEVRAWQEDSSQSEFLRVSALTRRRFAGEILEVRTKMGRRVRCTPDHPFVVADGSGRTTVKYACELTADDWLPLADPAAGAAREPELHLDVLAALRNDARPREDVIVRVPREEVAELGTRRVAAGIAELDRPRRPISRAHDIVRNGALRLPEAEALGLSLEHALFGTVRNGTYVPASIRADETFWRIVGLYLAEGYCSVDGRRHRIAWCFHPREENDLVEEVLRFWRLLGIKVTPSFLATTAKVSISSRLLAHSWLTDLGLGRNSYEQRLPDLIWEAPESHKWALLAGLWRGDGSWSYVRGGPSVVLEYGTVSRDLADGVLRLLGDLGIVASLRVGRTAKSTRDTYWLRISGAEQVERSIELAAEGDRPVVRDSIQRQSKRIAPTGYRRHASGTWVRVVEVTRLRFGGFVYSLEVPGAHTFVTSGGLVTHNCFPKDISFLKLLAGNSGYHFQLLNAVIEVNELQKRRVITKLQKHLGSLRGKTVALLGLAFKPNTDDMRDAPSLVIASRLLAEGAEVRTWDPVANARDLIVGASQCDTVEDAVRDADAAVIVTEWDQLRALPTPEIRGLMRKPLIVDGRNLLDPAEARAAGFAYEGIGRPTSPLDALPETPEPERTPALEEE